MYVFDECILFYFEIYFVLFSSYMEGEERVCAPNIDKQGIDDDFYI